MLTSRILASPVTDEAFSAVWNADNAGALALLHNVDAPGCASMRARTWYRVKRFDRVIAEFERRDLTAYGPQEACELACRAALAHAALGDRLQAQRALGAARSAASRSHDSLLRIEHGYASARVDLIAGNLEGSRQTLGDVASFAAAHSGAEPRTEYQLELNHLLARICQLNGIHRGLDGDHAGQEECYLNGLLVAELARHRDLWFEAHLLAMLAESLAAFPSQHSRQYVLSRSISFSWNSHLDNAASVVKCGLRNNRRLFGFDEPVETFGGRTAPSLAARLGERIDALLLDEWQNGTHFFEEMRFAISIALDVDWTATSDHETVHLARLAVLLTPYEPALAQKMGDRYAGRLPGTGAVLREPRREMLEVFLDGCLAKAAGRSQTAGDKLQRAIDFWRGCSLVWMAAIAGIERFAVSRDGGDLVPALDFLRAHPKTTFSRRLRQALERAQLAEHAEFGYLGLHRAA